MVIGIIITAIAAAVGIGASAYQSAKAAEQPAAAQAGAQEATTAFWENWALEQEEKRKANLIFGIEKTWFLLIVVAVVAIAVVVVAIL